MEFGSCRWTMAASLSVVSAAAGQCPAEGSARSGTVAFHMNPYKNRDEASSQTNEVEVADILGYASSEDESIEQRGVVLKGQLLTYKHEGPESPNCESKTRRDFHIWLGAMSDEHPNGQTLSPDELKTAKIKAVVVELTPNIQDEHPSWASRLGALRYKYICVQGWLFFDHEHADQVGKTRGTQWEVHPITAIGVMGSDGTCRYWN